MSESLTILLTLKDRSAFTQRWLDYAAAVNLPFPIVIADGSIDDAAAPMVEGYRAAGRDVCRIRYPVDRDYETYYRKLADSLARVRTPYVVLADNDDFFFVEGLSAAVQFLDTHPDYVACGGQCAVFWLPADGARQSGQLYGDGVEWKCSGRMHSDTAERASQRIVDQAMSASDMFYSVHRTELLRGHFERVRDVNPHDLFLMEQVIAFLTAVTGKSRQLDQLYIARQQDSPDSSGGAHQDRFGGWMERMLLPTWSDDFARFVSVCSAALAAADGIADAEARRVIIDSYKMSVAPSLLADLMEQPTVNATMPLALQVVRRLVRLPRSSAVRRLAQFGYRRLRWVSHDLVHGTEFTARRAPDAERTFAAVRDFLLRPTRQRS